MKLTPSKVWNEYQDIVSYVTQRHLYDIVKQNEKFYDGDQWDGLDEDNSLPRPVINIIQRVIKYQVATLSTNDVAVSLTPHSDNEEDNKKLKPIASEIERVIEQAKIKESAKLVIKNGAVDGACYMMQEFDPDFDTKQDIKGRVINKLVDNTSMYFGNPYSNDIQTQPFIIVALRQYVKQVQQEAKKLGLSENQIAMITPDNADDQANDDSDKLVTVLLRFERRTVKVEEKIEEVDEFGNTIIKEIPKEVESIWFSKSTQSVFLKEPVDLGYKRYPISQFGWDPIKNSYLYNSPITPVIPNQIFINKCYAIAQMYGLQSAFPKIVYDKAKLNIKDILGNTKPVAVANLDLMGKFLDFIKVPDFSNNILSLVDSVTSQTKECMGINDASLGNVKPDNTSAIIALQEGSNVPLEIQRQEYYEMWEDTVRNILDIMASSYGTREIMSDEGLATIDFSLLHNLNYDLNVDIGSGAQYSEIAQINTLDKLFQAGVINAELYVDAIPNKYIPNKGKILQHLKELADQNRQQLSLSQPVETQTI